MINTDSNQYDSTLQFLNLFGDKHQYFALPSKGEDGFYGRFAVNVTGLVRENQAGKDIYFTVNETKPGTKRTKDKYVRTRAVWIDDDGVDKHGGLTDPDKFPLEPNIVVNSSPGKYHYYWLTSTDDAEETEQILRGMAKEFHGDPKVTDRLRVLRLPGFTHNKSRETVTYEILNAEPYPWVKILSNFPRDYGSTIDSVDNADNTPSTQFSVKECIDDILTGENVHGSRVRLSMHWANSGMPEKDALIALDSYVDDAVRNGTVEISRALERKANMKAAVRSAYAKVELEQAPKFQFSEEDEQDKFTRFSKANGVLGEIADDVMVYMPFPSYEMALVVAQHIVSVFGGGLYHVKNKTLTRKRTILAPTGRGKSIVDKYYNELVRRMALRDDMVNPYNFNGNNSYAVNNIHMELIDHRVRSYIMSEAGLMGKTTAGTTSETRAYILNLISSSRKSATNTKLLSIRTSENRKLNDSLKTVYGAVAVFLSESVPAQYVEVLNNSDAFLSGDVAREELIFVDPKKPPTNYNAEGEIADIIVDRMAYLAKKFEDFGHMTGDNPSNPDFFEQADFTLVDRDYIDFCEDNVKQENDANKEGNLVKAATLSRVPEKVLVTSLVQAVADSSKQEGIPVVTLDHLNWAIGYHRELLRSLSAQQAKGSLADPVDLCVERVKERCKKFGDYSDDHTHSVDMRKKIVSRRWFTKVLDKSKVRAMQMLINRYGRREMAMREVVQHCEDINLVTRLPDRGKTQVWRINT